MKLYAQILTLVTLLTIQSATGFGTVATAGQPQDPSATFSTQLSFPPARSSRWAVVRNEILRGEYAQAYERLRMAPPSAGRWFWHGVLLLHERRTFASIRSLERAARLQDDSQVETMLAVDYFLLNQRLLAEDALKRALELDPHSPMTLYLRGRLAFVSDNFHQAQRDFTAMLVYEPDDYHALYYRALSEQRLGLNSDARKDLQRAVDVLTCLHLDFAQAPYALAQTELNAGYAAPALRYATLALKMAESADTRNGNTEEVARILALRARTENRMGRAAAAEHDLASAVKFDPYFAEAWYLMSRLYRKQGKLAQATQALERFREIQGEL